jgi:hypothetical protein
MTNLKFKLKLGGKCVGYERSSFFSGHMSIWHSENGAFWRMLYGDMVPGAGEDFPFAWIPHDEKCPFVCLDRNGKEVYEGDKIHKGPKEYIVVPYHDEDGRIGWVLRMTELCASINFRTEQSIENPIFRDIELIPDEVTP